MIPLSSVLRKIKDDAKIDNFLFTNNLHLFSKNQKEINEMRKI